MLPNRYDFREVEPRLARLWADSGTYAYDPDGPGPTFTVDTPPPTVSGQLHLGHVYSYTQADVIARYRRMRGDRVCYPMGFDDNGLATERFVEKTLGRRAAELGREPFIAACLDLTRRTEDRFEALWRRLGLSIDWRHRYSTIAPAARRAAQYAFIELHRSGRAYAQLAPTLWCPECRTAIAQAEVDDVELETVFATLAFRLPDGAALPIATTRPELLPACTAVFVHPADARYRHLVGSRARLPLYDREVPILADAAADPRKGSGAIMCCTFGDATDVRWWRAHDLPLRAALDREGRMTTLAGAYAGLAVPEARGRILADLEAEGLLLGRQSLAHRVGTHERCGTPVEYLHTRQWFIRVLDLKPRLLAAGRRIRWYPAYMRARYEGWVEQLQWDWCISRQRYFGVPFPAWTCRACGATLLADRDQLPVDPLTARPPRPCACGADDAEPEPDVMDTWATSSCTPFIIAGWPDDAAAWGRHFPASLRPQAHDIIRTWAFYTIVQSLAHTGKAPWRAVMVSGHGLSADRRKLSKSRDEGGGAGPGAAPGPKASPQPDALIAEASADALRYWATAGRTGADTPFTPETLETGRRLVTKLWNAGRFAEGRLADFAPAARRPPLLPTDRWLLARLAAAVRGATAELERYEYAAARAEVERFFWSDLCDNYLELAKARLYGPEGPARTAARWTLYHALLATLKLLAPYLPYVTEDLYQGLFRAREGAPSIHRSEWPRARAGRDAAAAEAFGRTLLDVLGQVRAFKAERGLSVGAELEALVVRAPARQLDALEASRVDLRSATRARRIELVAGGAEDGRALVRAEPAAGGAGGRGAARREAERGAP